VLRFLYKNQPALTCLEKIAQHTFPYFYHILQVQNVSITYKTSRQQRADLFTEVIIPSALANRRRWTLTSEQETKAKGVQTTQRKPQTHENF